MMKKGEKVKAKKQKWKKKPIPLENKDWDLGGILPRSRWESCFDLGEIWAARIFIPDVISQILCWDEKL